MLGRLFKQNQLAPLGHNQSISGSTANTNSSNSPHTPHNNHGTYHQPKNGSVSSTIKTPYQHMNSFEDSYSREILYGTSDILQLRSYQFNSKFFRIILSQDGGNLRSKQVLYDSSTQNTDNNGGLTRPQATSRNNSSNNVHNKNILTSKIYHNASELNDYMFGCGLPTNESHCTTKMHILPALNNLTYGSNQSILITRLFLISENNDQLQYSDTCAQWRPRPALPIKETSLKDYAFSIVQNKSTEPDSNGTSKSTNNINSRFAIGLIIPIESLADDLNDVIFNNWDEISHYLIVLQKLIIKKLILALNNSLNDPNFNNINTQHTPHNSYCPYIINKRIQFPCYILQNEQELNNQLIKLIKLIHYDSNIPKLINSNSLMRSSLNNIHSEYNPMLFNWISEVLNWLQFKDGRSVCNDPMSPPHSNFDSNCHFQHYNSNNQSNTLSLQSSPSVSNLHMLTNNTDSPITKTFLASLLSLLIPLRHLLTIKPLSNSNDCKDTREVTRVIIMTGNPVVAKKLIFIINGLIPNNDMLSMIDEYESEISELSSNLNEFKISQQSGNEIPETKKGDELNTRTNFSNDYLITPSMQRKNSESANDLNNIGQAIIGKNTRPVPMQIKSSIASSYSSSDNSPTHTTSSKGWEIPYKSSASTTTTPYKSRVEVGASVIPIAQKTPARSSLSKSSSMAYLSSSLTSSLSSSASNYSLSKLGGSFMEKWKNSFTNNQHMNSNSNTTNAQTNVIHGFSNDNNDFLPPNFNSIPKKNSVHSLRTPSPAVDNDEYFSYHNNSSNIGNISQTPLGSSRLSRPLSFLDLHMNNANHKRNGIGIIHEEGKLLEMKIKRSNTSLYSTALNNKTMNTNDFNRNIIKSKCSKIMTSNISIGESLERTLEVKPIYLDKKRNISDSYYEDESTITSASKTYEPSKLIKHKPLSPNVAFTEEFRPEFILQSCPINPKLESQVMTSMKNDLLFYQNNCEFDKVVSRSVFISLRAKEIKVIEMKAGGSLNKTEDKVLYETPFASSNKPLKQSTLTSVLKNSKNDLSRGLSSGSYKTTIKKVFTPTRNLGDKDVIRDVENTLDEINKLFQSHNMTEKDQAKDRIFNERLMMLMSNILK